MSPTVLVAAVAFLSAGVALIVTMYGKGLRPPLATNHRGARLPVVLGMAVTGGILVGSLAVLWSDFDNGEIVPTIRGALQIMVALIMVFVAGLFDDAQPGPVRGLRAHGKALTRGRVTSGMVKLVAIVAAAAVLVEATRGLSLGTVVGVLFIAGSANLWNLLDAAPGRSMKFFVLAALGLQVAVALLSPCATCGFSVFVLTALAAVVVVLPFDLREHAMLGDGGANLLGFLVGGGLFLRLSTTWLWIGLGVVLLLTLLAETVTLTRIIRGVSPLRWFDDMGRVGEARTQAVVGES